MGVNEGKSNGGQPTSNNGSDSCCSRCCRYLWCRCCPEKRRKVAPSKSSETITSQPVGTVLDKSKGSYGSLATSEFVKDRGPEPGRLADNSPNITIQPGLSIIDRPGTLRIDQSSGNQSQFNQSNGLENQGDVIPLKIRSSSHTPHEPNTLNSTESTNKIVVDGTTIVQIESVPPSPAPEIPPATSTDYGSVIPNNSSNTVETSEQQESPTEKTSTVSNSYDVNPSVPSSPTGSELNNTINNTTVNSPVPQSDQSSDNVVQHPAMSPVVLEPVKGPSPQDPSPLFPPENQGVPPQNPIATTDGISQHNAEASDDGTQPPAMSSVDVDKSRNVSNSQDLSLSLPSENHGAPLQKNVETNTKLKQQPSASAKRPIVDGPKKVITKKKKSSSDKALPKSTEPLFKEGDKIVLLLGETGVGKSTFVNSILNYLSSPSLEEAKNSKAKILIPTRVDRYNEDYVELKPYFFTHNLGKHIVYNEEVKKGQSLTQEARHYTLKYGPDKRLVLIDTAGIGDTRGVEYDKTNLEQLKEYLYKEGIREVHGICILLHPNYKHLTAGLKYTLHSTIDFFGPSSFDNIFFCFTRTASTSYKPGDTLSALRQFLENNTKYSQTLTTTPKNVFCFENSCFREKLIMEKSPEQQDEFILERASESWKISAENMNKLIGELEDREKPFQIPDDWFGTIVTRF